MDDVHQHNHEHRQNLSPLQVELLEHAPFSVSAVAIGLVVAGLVCYLTPAAVDTGGAVDDHGHEASYALFHLFHPTHMFFSAAATTAMFWRYDHSWLKAIMVGAVGAIGVCGISDIGMPHVSLLIMGRATPLHICVIEHPGLVFPFAAMGVPS